jgi:hypothetical protein
MIFWHAWSALDMMAHTHSPGTEHHENQGSDRMEGGPTADD